MRVLFQPLTAAAAAAINPYLIAATTADPHRAQHLALNPAAAAVLIPQAAATAAAPTAAACIPHAALDQVGCTDTLLAAAAAAAAVTAQQQHQQQQRQFLMDYNSRIHQQHQAPPAAAAAAFLAAGSNHASSAAAHHPPLSPVRTHLVTIPVDLSPFVFISTQLIPIRFFNDQLQWSPLFLESGKVFN